MLKHPRLIALHQQHVKELETQGVTLTPDQLAALKKAILVSYSIGAAEEREARDMYDARVEADM